MTAALQEKPKQDNMTLDKDKQNLALQISPIKRTVYMKT